MWVNERTGAQVSEDSNTLILSPSSIDDFATYTCAVTNDAGATGSENVTIEQGCKHYNDSQELVYVKLIVNHVPYRFVAR